MDLSLEKTKLATGEAKIYSVEVELVRVTRVVRRHHSNGKAKEDVVEEEGVVRSKSRLLFAFSSCAEVESICMGY